MSTSISRNVFTWLLFLTFFVNVRFWPSSLLLASFKVESDVFRDRWCALAKRMRLDLHDEARGVGANGLAEPSLAHPNIHPRNLLHSHRILGLPIDNVGACTWVGVQLRGACLRSGTLI